MQFGYARIDVRCPMCELVDRQLIADLITAQSTSCGYCGTTIDLTSAEWQTHLAAAAREASTKSTSSR